MAAGRTVDRERRVHSMHAYFLKLGDPKVPVVYEVDRIRDGPQLHHAPRRRHPARHRDLQHGGVVPGRRARARPPRRRARGRRHPSRLAVDLAARSATTSSSRSTGRDHRTSSTRSTCATSGRSRLPVGVRGEPVRDPDQDTWFRTRGPLPDDPLLHTCIVAYASDLTLLGTALAAAPDDRRAPRLHGREPRPRDVVPPSVPRRRLVAVPHAQPVGRGGRGFATGQVFCADGTLAVSVAQEGLVRPVRAVRDVAGDE